jgi:nucleoside 2-deoxyribosyltransferase
VEKRYQTFVSSTYEDLREERQAVIQALLELDCMPYGMELFPAADEEQWKFIQRAIDDCDYYIVIVGGKYGSIGPGGKSYTHMEYEYAINKGKPVIAFLHENPGKLPAERSESTEQGKSALDDFRTLARTRLCKSWNSTDHLGSVVSRSMVQLIKSRPAVGWVRANLVADESAAQEITRLRRKIEELEADLTKLSLSVLAEPVDAGHGERSVQIRFAYIEEFKGKGIERSGVLEVTWNEIFAALGAKLLTPNSEPAIQNALTALINVRHPVPLSMLSVKVERHDFDGVLVQLTALGYIAPETQGYPRKWALTPAGRSTLFSLAIKPKPNSK